MPPGSLAQMLSGFRDMFPEELTRSLLVGLEEPDDAAVYQLDPDRALIFTADFFPPVVDEASAYGAIAAANALNDVYAMGGRPILALNLATFPEDMPSAVARDILQGAAFKVREAGAVVAGGHTTRGEEPVFGLAVIGLVHPEALVRKSGARPGDRLLLSKPLGTGVLTTAGKAGAAAGSDLAEAIVTMASLNDRAARAAAQVGVRAGTDVTGFGLAGHAVEIAEASGVALCLQMGRLPWLSGAFDCASAGWFPGGEGSNASYFGSRVNVRGEIGDVSRRLLFSPETAGGLLLAVPPAHAASLIRACRSVGQTVWEIGEVAVGAGVTVTP